MRLILIRLARPFSTTFIWLVWVLTFSVRWTNGADVTPSLNVPDHVEIPASSRGVHPRLFLDEKGIEKLVGLIPTSPVLGQMLDRLQDEIKRSKTPKANGKLDRDDGDRLLNIVALYRFTGDKAYLKLASEYVAALLTCPATEYTSGSFGTCHYLCAMALYYDWCYKDLSDDEKEKVTSAMRQGAQLIYKWTIDNNCRLYLSNQLQVRLTGIGMVALALDDNNQQTADWIDFATQSYAKLDSYRGDDGVTIEGVGYGQYGVDFEMRFCDLAKELLGVNFYQSKWWYNNGLFQLYMTTPRHAWQKNALRATDMNVDLGDSPRYGWTGPDHLLRGIAKETGNGYAQWLADYIDANNATAKANFLNLLRYDPSVAPTAPDAPPKLPTLHHFENSDIVSARSDWSGDESLITFDCGPFFGHKGVDLADFDLGGGHAHPAANDFAIFGGGEWLVTFPGYIQRRGDYENTLIVDGVGQLGQSEKAGYWNAMPLIDKKIHPRILKAFSSPEFDQMTGDATPSYEGLNKYVRHLLFIKPNVLLVLDDIEADKSKDCKLFFHCEQPATKVVQQPDHSYLMTGEKAELLMNELTPENVSVQGGDFKFDFRHGDKVKDKFCLILESKTAAWNNATAFTWSDGSVPPASVTLTKKDNVWGFQIGAKNYLYDWQNDQLQVQ